MVLLEEVLGFEAGGLGIEKKWLGDVLRIFRTVGDIFERGFSGEGGGGGGRLLVDRAESAITVV